MNPAGQVGGEPAPKGQEFTYAIRAQGRLETPEQFSNIVLRANPDGSFVRLKDVARPAELGSQLYAMAGRLNGEPAAILALYQLPGTNAIAAVDGVKNCWKKPSVPSRPTWNTRSPSTRRWPSAKGSRRSCIRFTRR